MKIAIFNACESLNVGDQVISDCIIYLLKKHVSPDVVCYDILSGRDLDTVRINARNKNIHPTKKARKRIYPKLISTIKYIFKHNIKEKRYICNKRNAIKNSDAVFIGGGHLLIDTAGIFAININDIVDFAKSENKKIFVGMVGVRMPWSFIAKFYFEKLIKYSTTITVRDTASLKKINSVLNHSNFKVSATMDPAIFVDEVYADVYAIPRYEIGLCIISPSELIRAGSKINYADILRFWLELYAYLDEKHPQKICFFTNGSLQDEIFLDDIQQVSNINRLKKPLTSNELITNIKSCDSLIAQRLHTCLPALSMNKKVIGVKWDNKLEHIFNDLDVGGNMISFTDSIAEVYEKYVNACLVSETVKKSSKAIIINGLEKINEKNYQ